MQHAAGILDAPTDAARTITQHKLGSTINLGSNRASIHSKKCSTEAVMICSSLVYWGT
jgi:hypothetical protein